MDSFYSHEENINISENYFIFAKQISEDFIKYITNYKVASGDFLKKILNNQEKFNQKLLELKEQIKNIDPGNLISLASITPKVIEQQIINIDYIVKGINDKLNKFEKLLKDKNSEYLDTQNFYKDSKSELNKKYREIERIKINFMTNISLAEESIHKFYMKKNNKIKSSPKLLNISQLDANESNFISIEEQVNNSIQKTKKLENDYKSSIISLKDCEINYIETVEKFKDKTRKIICLISNNLKELISDSLMFLRNSFKMPLSEIDLYFKEVVDLDEYSNIDKLIQKSYKIENNLITMNLEKYSLQLFQSYNFNNNGTNKNISKRKNSSIDDLNKYINRRKNSSIDDLQEMDFTQEEEIFLTIKKMKESFELLEENEYNILIEEEKLRCKYLTLKILSFAPSNKLYSKQIPQITSDEVWELDKMLDKKQNRIIFIQKLSQFRTRGIFEFPKNEYNILSQLFNKIIKIVENEEDFDSAVNIIILSQTYYILKNTKKEYIQKAIMNNDLFKSKKFWETFVNYSINKEIELSKKTDELNGIKTENDKEKEEKNSNIVFAQIVPMTNNMIEFGLNINIVEEIIFPLIKQYKISPEFSEVVISVINIKKQEENTNNK